MSILEGLGRFLREAVQLVADQDERTTMESDDLLQAESVYGGPIEEGEERIGQRPPASQAGFPSWSYTRRDSASDR